MKAMIFAAGEGRRMRPLTLATPKPLLRVGDRSLLEHLIYKLHIAGIEEVVINVSYLADQILTMLKTVDLNGIRCHVSVEEQPLETGGALKRALPYLGDEPFLLVNSDVWCDLNLAALSSHPLPDGVLAHLVLVESPEHNQQGDFVIAEHGLVRRKREGDSAKDCLTFTGISIIHPGLIKRYEVEKEIFPLRELLYPAIAKSQVTAEYFPGFWSDIGTPERLESLRDHCKLHD